MPPETQNRNSNDGRDMLDKLLSFEGLYERVFGKLLDPLVFDRAIDNDIHTVGVIFGYRDAEDCMRRNVERNEFRGLSKILFKFHESSPNLPQ